MAWKRNVKCYAIYLSSVSDLKIVKKIFSMQDEIAKIVTEYLYDFMDGNLLGLMVVPVKNCLMTLNI